MRTFSVVSVLVVGAALMPTLVAAQTLLNTLGLVSTFLNALQSLFVTLAIVVFFWGLIKYLLGDGSEGKSEGLKIMMMGVVTIFVMVSIWGIIQLLQRTFGVTNNQALSPKTLPLDTRFVQ